MIKSTISESAILPGFSKKYASHDSENKYSCSESRFFRVFEFESSLLQAEALRFGMNTVRYAPTLLTARYFAEGPALGFLLNGSNHTSRWASALCANKQLTSIALRLQGIRVPEGRVFRHSDLQTATAFARSLSWPVVLKPLDGGGGRAVSVGLSDADQLRLAHALLRPGESFRVERHVEGRDCRVLVIGGRAASVLQRTPPQVVGDGTSSISELVREKNARRKDNPRYASSPIDLDGPSLPAWLERSSLTTESVPAAGQRVVLGGGSNVSLGGECVEVFPETDRSILREAESIFRAIGGLAHCGIDFILEDHRRPLTTQGYAVCEVNSHAELGLHTFPSRGKPFDAVGEVFRTNCRMIGLELGECREASSVVIRAEGVSDPKSFGQWVGLFAQAVDIEVSGLRIDSDTVVWQAPGPATKVAALAAKAIAPDSSIAVEAVITASI